MGDEVLLFDACLKLFYGKVVLSLVITYEVISITRHGAIGVCSNKGDEFQVNRLIDF